MIQGILDNSVSPIFIIDDQTRYLLVNHAYEDVVGLKNDEIIGKTPSDIFPEEIAEMLAEYPAQVIRDKVSRKKEEAFFIKNELHTFVTSMFPLFDDQGKAFAACGIATEISDRVRAETALKENEERFRSIFEQTAVAIITGDENRNILDCNIAAQKMLGYAREELIGKNISEISHPDDDVINMEFYNKVSKGKLDSFQMEKRYIRKHGTIMWGRLTLSHIVQNKTGNPEFHVAMVEDISENKRLEKELRLFKAIVESSHEAIAISDSDGQMVYINPAHEKLFGRSLEEAKLTNCRDYYPSESLELLNHVVVPALNEGRSWEGITDAFDADGSIFPPVATCGHGP